MKLWGTSSVQWNITLLLPLFYDQHRSLEILKILPNEMNETLFDYLERIS